MGAQQSSSHDTRQANIQDVQKKCYYEVLGVDRLASDTEIKKAYHKKALELHPDRNYGDAVNATARFAEVQAAYEILADREERAWYDSYRDSIFLRTTGRNPNESASSSSPSDQTDFRFTSADDVVRLTSQFQRSMPFTDEASGFYGIFGKAFADIAYEEEKFCRNKGLQPEAYPSFGSSDDDYETHVKPFYRAWVNFSTQKTFIVSFRNWPSEMANRATRRNLEKQQKRVSDGKMKELNNAVRAFAIFIRKRDPRYSLLSQTEENRQEILRRAAAAQAARSRAENQSKMANHIVPEWTKVHEQSSSAEEVFLDSEESETENIECVVCRKNFKSENQYQAHEKSKKHIKAVKLLKRELQRENKLFNLETSHNLELGGQSTNSQFHIHDKSESDLDTEIETKIECLGEEEEQEEEEISLSSNHDDNDDLLYQEMASHNLKELEPSQKDKNVDENKSSGNQNDGPSQRIGKAKLKRAKKNAKVKDSKADSTNLECKKCGDKFVSKNKLFHHIKESNHAQ